MVRRVEFLVITAWAFMCHAGISAATTNECGAVDSAGEAPSYMWWKFPIEMYEYDNPQPPKFLFEGTNCPQARIHHTIAIPGEGQMPKERYNRLQSAIGAFITHGKKPYCTVKEAVNRETIKFWVKALEEFKKDKDFDIECPIGWYELHSEIKYRGPKYVSYSMSEQDGSPSSTEFRNFVWSWDKMRQLRIDDVIDTKKIARLKAMIRAEGIKIVSDINESKYEMPKGSEGWPYDLSNFWIDDQGFVWREEIGWRTGYTITRIEIRLSWHKMRPLLREDFTLPCSFL